MYSMLHAHLGKCLAVLCIPRKSGSLLTKSHYGYVYLHYSEHQQKKYGDQNKNNNEKKNSQHLYKNAANAYQFHTISSGITMKSFATAHATIYFNLCWHFFVVCLKLVSTKNLDDDWNNSVQFELKMGVCGINKRDIYLQIVYIVCTVCHQSSYSVSFINLHAIIR